VKDDRWNLYQKGSYTMSNALNENHISVDATAELKSLKGEWKWLVALGLMLVVVGTFAIGSSFAATMVSVALFGVIMLVGGIAQILGAFRCPKWSGLLLQVLIGVLYLVGGYLVMEAPVQAALALTMLMSLFFLFGGVLRIIYALMYRFPSWGWTLFSGVVAVFLGLLIRKQWPVSGLWVIGLFVGIEMIINGWTFLALGLSARKLEDA
jgi:uncharacterized membrane protein HdeD (DUF308 family)